MWLGAVKRTVPVRGNYFIAVCDILGFSKLIRDKPLEVVVDSSIAWLKKSLHHSLHKDGFPKNTPSLQDFERHSHVGLAWFSDTILLYTKQDSDECVTALLSTVGWLIFETLVQGEMKIRSGISYGEAFVDGNDSLYVGRPIVDAYKLQQCQKWSGGALTQDAVLRVPEAYHDGHAPEWWLRPYSVPSGKDETIRTLAVDWTWGIHDHNLKLQWSEKSSQPSPEDWIRNPDICEKWYNTKKFHDDGCQWCVRRS
jgi:hypothetical protein